MRHLEHVQVVMGIMPYDTMDAAGVGDWVSMKNFHSLVVFFSRAVGTAGEDPTITIEQATDVSGSDAKALTFTDIYEKEGETNAAGGMAAIGTFTKQTQTAANTYTSATSGENEILWGIEFDADELDVDNGFDCVRASISDPGSGGDRYGVVWYELLESRWKQDPVLSAIID